MNPRVVAVEPLPHYTLALTFSNGERRLFDVKPYFRSEYFNEIKDMTVFRSVRPLLGSVQWPAGQDFCPDTLYETSTALESAVEERLAVANE